MFARMRVDVLKAPQLGQLEKLATPSLCLSTFWLTGCTRSWTRIYGSRQPGGWQDGGETH